MKKKFWTSDKLVGFTAMFISLLTLYIFIKQTNIMEEQSHLSVMPYLRLDTSDRMSDKIFSIDLVNYGVGPALIEKSTIYYKGETHQMQLVDFLKENFRVMDSIVPVNIDTMEPGTAIRAGDKINLITVSGQRSYTDFLLLLNQILEENINWEIKYKSIYDDRWKITTPSNIPIALE